MIAERITGALPNLRSLHLHSEEKAKKIILDSTHPEHLPLRTIAFWAALAFWLSMLYWWLYVPVGLKTSANVFTEWLDFESGKKYLAFWNVEFIFI